jgi:hypothetical protein
MFQGFDGADRTSGYFLDKRSRHARIVTWPHAAFQDHNANYVG